SFLVRTARLESQSASYEVRLALRVLIPEKVELIPGDSVELQGKLLESKERRVAALLIADAEFVELSKVGELGRRLAQIRSDFRNQAAKYQSNSAALIPGMILGDTSLQSQEFTKQMRRSGLAHLTAVSGANFAIVSALVFFLLRLVIPNLVVRIVTTGVVLFLFLLLVRPSPSVLRAGIMALVVLLAIATGNRANAAAALSSAVIVLLLFDPFQGQDPGFILSVLATAGLIFLSPGIKEFLLRFLPSWLAEIVAVSTAATLLCTPYLIAFTSQAPLLAIPLNIATSLLVAPVTVIGFLSVLSLPISFISEGLFAIAEFLARWIAYLASLSDQTPTLSLSYQLLLVTMAIVVGVLFFAPLRRIGIAALVALIFFGVVSNASFPGDAWRVVQCDVGQGDALVLKISQESALLFDAGPDPDLLDRCLKSIGVKHLPLIVLSHNHADHYYGVSGALRDREIGQIWSNGNISRAELSNYPVSKVGDGYIASIADVSLEVLWPPATTANFSNLSGDGSQENNRSLVILAQVGQVKILITGDIEPEAQEEIARKYNLSGISILKVPHHGSRFQSELFLSQISPKISFISVGESNSYGHPDADLLEKLKLMGSRVYRSDRDGPISLSWRFDDEAMSYIFTSKTLGRKWWQIQWL
ncbi:MAG: MBL fold metallo-hydrolase, partial [Actinobacteria bacterium]|nr:MBL fold metallo-hydrolase [Actinomycetota bacterium]